MSRRVTVHLTPAQARAVQRAIWRWIQTADEDPPPHQTALALAGVSSQIERQVPPDPSPPPAPLVRSSPEELALAAEVERFNAARKKALRER